MDAPQLWLLLIWIALHLAALLAAFGTRIAIGSRIESLAQFICLVAMALIGVLAWVAQQTQSGSWGLSAGTLMAMVLTAVVDFRRLHEHHPSTEPIL
ncbi:MAG: hypothetical protein IT425_03960 [Pirellulales bacterium]|nr:hypothetical protein [Pirellulales bacterium]